jgi:undecaprenyl-diphosphatase
MFLRVRRKFNVGGGVIMLLYLWMIVQVIGESLPISSSGHVILLQRIMKRCGLIEFAAHQNLWAFDYVLQGVSAIVFLLYFFPYWWELIVRKSMRISSLLDGNVWKKNIFPVFVFGLVADSMTFLLWSCNITDWLNFSLAFGFMITATVLWNTQFMHPDKDLKMWSWENGVIVGLMQGCALLPGISRFGITIATLQWLGYPGRLAFSISFLLQWPLIVAGSFAGFYALVHDQSILQTVVTVPFLMIMALAGCISYAILYGMGKIIDKKLLWEFSYYMIIPIMVALLI